MKLQAIVFCIVFGLVWSEAEARARVSSRHPRQVGQDPLAGWGTSQGLNFGGLFSGLLGKEVPKEIGQIGGQTNSEIGGLDKPGFKTSENNCFFGICTRKTGQAGDLEGGLRNFGAGGTEEVSFPLLTELLGFDIGSIGGGKGGSVNPFTGEVTGSESVKLPFGIETQSGSNFKFPGLDSFLGDAGKKRK